VTVGGGKRSGDKETGGIIFEITPSGILTTLHMFCSVLNSKGNCTDGQGPSGELVPASNGNFYGTTINGGPSTASQCSQACGTIFGITPAGKLTTLYSFCAQDTSCPDGAHPGALIQATDGNFYGTTNNGGANSWGTLFRITPAGSFTTLYSFCQQANCTDGKNPTGPLVQASDGNLYGIAGGGTNGNGEIFELTLAGQFIQLYNFCSQANCGDGSGPDALMQATDGNFYGFMADGGSYIKKCQGFGCGAIFSLSIGLSPFVETIPKAAKAGVGIGILGNNLTGATAVTFDGTAAKFKVVSATLIEAQVPAGATTGTIQVATPGGTLSSNVAFQILP
jgi:uncharacterized repeat protein (TIGR03803 family)